MSQYQPPLTVTSRILALVAEISEQIGQLSAQREMALTPHLRRGNRIRTIQASLAIENNTLSVEQVTAVLEGKRVLGLPHEVQEVRNAFAAYEAMSGWRADSQDDLRAAHALLMQGLIDDAGRYRRGGVGIYRGERLLHMAPPANRVATLMGQLLRWLGDNQWHPLIVSCVFHYEFEFIHPFADGNGRMGRLWQTLILSQWRPVLAWLPVESVIRDRQADYYAALAAADGLAEATPFVEFMLQALQQALAEALAAQGQPAENASGKVTGKTSGKILDIIARRRDVTIPELAALTGVTERTVERNLRQLQAAKRLRRVGPARGGYWQIIE
jgi:Fic family protein